MDKGIGMGKQFIKFRESRLFNTIRPSTRVLNGITRLETALLNEGLIDESIETMLISSYHLTYKKNGKDILIIFPFKDSWSTKVIGTQWNLQQLFHLPVLFKFEIEKTGWVIHNLNEADEEDLTESFIQALKSTTIDQLILYPLSVLYSYFLKNPILFSNVNEETLNEVKSLFWQGDIGEIRKLSNEVQFNENQNSMSEFLTRWFDQLNVKSTAKLANLSGEMNVTNKSFLTILSLLRIYINSSFSSYRNSLADIWQQSELLKDKEVFHSKVEELRNTILLTEKFLSELKDLEQLPDKKLEFKKSKFIKNEQFHSIKEEKNEGNDEQSNAMISPKSIASMGKTDTDKNDSSDKDNDWFEFIVNEKGSFREIPFYTKQDLFGENTSISLTINKQRLEILVDHLVNYKNWKYEYINMIELLVERCSDEGYLTKEKLKALFMDVYKDDIVLNEFLIRNSIKNISKAHQTLSTRFHVVLEQLRKQGLIKEIYQWNAYRVYWNFAVFVHSSD